MVPWIQVYSNFPNHQKVGQMSDLLSDLEVFVSNETLCVGLAVSLWCWAIQNQPDGILTKVPNRTLARACGWEGDPNELKQVLIEAGFIDIDNEDIKIHDWNDYCLLYKNEAERKAKQNRDRVARYRERIDSLHNIDDTGTDYDAVARDKETK